MKTIKFALMDPAIAIASLFRPITAGPRPRSLEVIVNWENTKITITNPVWLDSRDQSVLFACAALAKMSIPEKTCSLINKDSTGEVEKALWSDLGGGKASTISFKTTYRELMRESGLMGTDKIWNPGEKEYNRIKNILFNLFQTSIRIQTKGAPDSPERLISYSALPNGEIHIAINERIARSLIGRQFKRFDLVERYSLKNDISQLTHATITAITNHGCNNFRVGLDVLANRVWGFQSDNQATIRKRRERIKSALIEIGGLCGWKTKIEGIGANAIASINRPLVVAQAENISN